jgi:hypothetical protein
MVLVHAVSTKVLSGPSSNMKNWISAISQVPVDHHDIVHDKVCVIGGEVTVIVGEVERNIRKWKFVSMWKFFQTRRQRCLLANSTNVSKII